PADRDRASADQWRVGAAVVVCHRLDNRTASADIVELGKRQGDARRRNAIMVVQDMGRQAARNRQFVGGLNPVTEPQRADAKDFAERGFKFSFGGVSQTPFVLAQDRILGMAAHAENERNVEFLPVGVAQSLKQRVLGMRKSIESGSGLFGFR